MLKNVSRLTRPLANRPTSSSSTSSSLPPPPSLLRLPPLPWVSSLPRQDLSHDSPHHRVGIFWDSENCGRYKPLKSLRFLNELRRIAGGPLSFIKIYEDKHSTKQSIDILEDSGVHVVRFSAGGRKDVADHLISADMFSFAAEFPESTLVLVSGDSDFSYPLHMLSQRGHRIIIVTQRSLFRYLIPKDQTNTVSSTSLLLSSTSVDDIYDLRALSAALDVDLELEVNLAEEDERQRWTTAHQVSRTEREKEPRKRGLETKQAWAIVRSFLNDLQEEDTRHHFSLSKFKVLGGRRRLPAMSFLQYLRSQSS